MTQAPPTIGANKSGLVYRQEDNDGKKALLTHHKGSSAPGYAEAGTIWIDDAATPWKMKLYDGSDWITLADINATTDSVAFYSGTGAARLLPAATDSGSANALAITPLPGISSYATGLAVIVKPAAANTGAATLAVSGLTAKSIKTIDGAALTAGMLSTSAQHLLVYDGTNFILLNPAVLPIALGGTGATTAAAARTALMGVSTTVDNTLPRFDGTSGQIKTSGVKIDDSNVMTGASAIVVNNTTSNGAGLEVYRNDVTAYSASATDGQLTAGATLYVNGPGAANNGLTQIVLRQRGAFSRIAVTGGTGGHSMKFCTDSTERMALTSGLVMTGATGGDKGAGTINATAVYDDNTLLTCYVGEAARTGSVNLAEWDAYAPPTIIDGVETPRQHTSAHRFAARLGGEYDPLDIDKYWAHFMDKGHLTSMPNAQNFNPLVGISAGEIAQRLWETVEILTVHIHKLNQRVKTLEDAGTGGGA